MSQSPKEPPASTETRLALAEGHILEVFPRPEAAVVTLRSPGNQVLLSFEVAITPAGAVIRGRAAALEIDASRVATRCDEFLVDARERIELRSAGDIDVNSSLGGVRVKANDDVQLLGEQVLLNCERPAPMPAWVPPPALPPALLPRQDESGDPDLVRELAAPPDPDAAR